MHSGTDVGMGIGTDLGTSLGGKVTFAGEKGGYGKALEVMLSNGQKVFYAHLDQIFVKMGEVFDPGKVLAKSGNTGDSTAPHLHFEGAQGGKSADAAPYIVVGSKELEKIRGGGTPANAIVPGPSANPLGGQTTLNEANGKIDLLNRAATGGPVPVTVTNPGNGLVPSDPIGKDGLPSEFANDAQPAPVSSSPAKFGGLGDTSFADIEAKAKGYSDKLGALPAKVDQTISFTDAINIDLGVAQGSTGGFASGLEKATGTIGGIVGVLGSVAMGIAGIGQMKKGGAYNTLMGLAGIFGAIGGIAGAFGKGGGLSGLFRASGGPVTARQPYIVGEQGPELIFPEANGTVVPAGQTKSLISGTRSALDQQRAAASSRAQAMQAPMAPAQIDLRYESQVINQVEYVTAEQHRQGMREAALMGQSMAYSGMRNSVRTRRGLGI